MRHALSALKLTVQGAYDEVTPGTNNIDANTHINIESVSIKATLPTSGKLNLNNTDANEPLWEETSTTAEKTFSLITTDLVENLRYANDANSSTIKPGVGRSSESTLIATAQDVIAKVSDKDRYFMFIPNKTATDFEVNIKYHVWTTDAALSGGFAKVENEITKTISLTPQGGKLYTINMILGMTTVKLEANVVDWDKTTAATPVDLPKNVTPATP